ncbi:MAG: acyl-CoA dehydrogenase family protein [Saprospiraceae bacterium]|nr:acyl-CoA dehydrogenase family protein [Saprospiraceae bacterium]
MYDFSMTEAQKALQEEIRGFGQEVMTPGAAQRDVDHYFDRSIWTKSGDLGIPGLTIPASYGGRGLDAVSTVIALEALGYGSTDSGMNFSLAAHLLACVIPIWLYGSESQKQRLLPSLCDGSWIATNAMTEPTAGSDAFNLASVAEAIEGGYILNGHKNFCSNGPVADLVLSYHLTDASKGFFGGISAFLSEKGKHDFEASEKVEKMGVRTCQMGEIRFTNTAVDEEALLGRVGAGGMIFNHSMEWERICLGALHIGAMDRMMKKAVKFAKERKSGGKSISAYQAVSHPLANLQVRIDSARLLTYKAAWKLDQKKPVGYDAALCKLAVSETYKDFAIQLNQLFAGKAFRENSDVEQILRDAVGSTIYSGTSEVLRNITARHMGMN